MITKFVDYDFINVRENRNLECASREVINEFSSNQCCFFCLSFSYRQLVSYFSLFFPIQQHRASKWFLCWTTLATLCMVYLLCSTSLWIRWFFLLYFTDSTLFRRFRECFLQMFKIKATTIQVAKSKIKSIIQHPLQGCNT